LRPNTEKSFRTLFDEQDGHSGFSFGERRKTSNGRSHFSQTYS